MNQHFAHPEVARLTISEAAKHLGASIASIRRWTESGDLKCSRTPGNQRRFSIEDLNRFNEQMRKQ